MTSTTSTTQDQSDLIWSWLDSTEVAIELPPLHIPPPKLLFRACTEYNTMYPYTDHDEAYADGNQQNPNAHQNSPAAAVFDPPFNELPYTPAPTQRSLSSRHGRQRSLPTIQTPSPHQSARIEKSQSPKKNAVSPTKRQAIYNHFVDTSNTPQSHHPNQLPPIKDLLDSVTRAHADGQIRQTSQMQMGPQHQAPSLSSGFADSAPFSAFSNEYGLRANLHFPVRPPHENIAPMNGFDPTSPVKGPQPNSFTRQSTPPRPVAHPIPNTPTLSAQQDTLTDASTAPSSPGRDFEVLEHLVTPVRYEEYTQSTELPSDIRNLWERLEAIGNGFRVVPASLRQNFNKVWPMCSW
jgi:hypothetical protein